MNRRNNLENGKENITTGRIRKVDRNSKEAGDGQNEGSERKKKRSKGKKHACLL